MYKKGDLFKFNFSFDADDFKDAKFWINGINSAFGTAAWAFVTGLLASSGLSAFALGAAFLLVNGAIGGNYNGIVNFSRFLQGQESLVNFIFNFAIFQIFGGACFLWVFNFFGFYAFADASADFLSFDFSNWKGLFFSGEFFGIFVYTLFLNKTENSRAGIADGFWDIALIALAQAAGAKFFFPAAAFFGAEGAFFARFVNVGAWATVFFQFLASLVFAVIAEYVW